MPVETWPTGIVQEPGDVRSSSRTYQNTPARTRSLPGVPRRIVRSPKGVPSVDRHGEAQPLLSDKTDGRSPRLATMVMREDLASPLMDNAVRQIPPRRTEPLGPAPNEPDPAHAPTEANCSRVD